METGFDKNIIVKKISEEISKKYPGVLSGAQRDISILPISIPNLSPILSKNGLPLGEIIEIVGAKSSGKTTFLYKILSGISYLDRFIVYFDFQNQFYPPSAKAVGLNLDRLIKINPNNFQSSLRAAELLFQTKEIIACVFDLAKTKETIPKSLILRLRQSLRESKGITFFLREPGSSFVPRNQIAIKFRVKRRKYL